MYKNSMLADLLKERELIRMQMHVLRDDLEAVNRLLKRFSKNQQAELPISTQLPQLNVLGLTEAVKQFFENFPDKEWAPAELRDRLKEMRRRGELKSGAKDFLPTIHMIIRKLIEKDFIYKVKEQTNPPRKWFKKKYIKNERIPTKYDIRL